MILINIIGKQMLDLVYIYVHGDVNSWKWATHKSCKLGSPWTMMISQYCGCVNKIVFYWMWRYDLWEEIYIYVVSQKDSWLSVDLSALIWSRPPYWDRTRRRVWGRCLGTAELAPGSLSYPAVRFCYTFDSWICEEFLFSVEKYRIILNSLVY